MSNYLIIGASSGIGKKLAEQLVDTGHSVYATYFKNKPEANSGLPDYHYLNVTLLNHKKGIFDIVPSFNLFFDIYSEQSLAWLKNTLSIII